jgi:hypothetical protein
MVSNLFTYLISGFLIIIFACLPSEIPASHLRFDCPVNSDITTSTSLQVGIYDYWWSIPFLGLILNFSLSNIDVSCILLSAKFVWLVVARSRKNNALSTPHRRHCHLLQLTRDHDTYMTTQISDISRSTGDEADEASFRSKIAPLLSSESTSSSSTSDGVRQLHTDVDASDDNTMKRFQMASTGKKSAQHCTALHYIVLRCSVLYLIIPHCTALHYTVL